MGCVYEPDGTVGAVTYPLAKKAHSQEFLRSIAHLRPRTKVSFFCFFFGGGVTTEYLWELHFFRIGESTPT